jgi:hypothetical protein
MAKAGGWRLGAGGWGLGAGGWRLEAGGWRLEAGGWRLEVNTCFTWWRSMQYIYFHLISDCYDILCPCDINTFVKKL